MIGTVILCAFFALFAIAFFANGKSRAGNLGALIENGGTFRNNCVAARDAVRSFAKKRRSDSLGFLVA